jgi:hypothetical protein
LTARGVHGLIGSERIDPEQAPTMSEITREQLHAYLDDALAEAETARVEQALRSSEPLRQRLRTVMQERDRGEHSLGAIWRRERLTCPSRETLGSLLLDVLDDAESDYIRFHIETVGCPFCVANLMDLQNAQKEPGARAKERRKRFFQSSAGYLQSREG